MRRFDLYIPESLSGALEYLDAHQEGTYLIANGSDLINRIQRRQVSPKVLVDLSGLSELSYVRNEDGIIRIGALTTVSEIVESPLIDSRLEIFREVAAKFGGPSICNVATIGGNICAASSSEDLIPVLLVLDADVRLKSKDRERVLRLEDFLRGKRLTELRSNEILMETAFRQLDENSTCAFEKVGMRNSLIIAFVSSAVYLKLDRSLRRIDDIRIAFNRVAGKIPERTKRTEGELRGTLLTPQTTQAALSMLRRELRPTSDFRVSAEYRLDAACVLFKRALDRCVRRLIGETILV